jgi:hypothetical protein
MRLAAGNGGFGEDDRALHKAVDMLDLMVGICTSVPAAESGSPPCFLITPLSLARTCLQVGKLFPTAATLAA